MEPRFHGHAYLVRQRSPRQLTGAGVLLVGDAAGLAYGESGEGIRPAVESALLAARTIVEARGVYDTARLRHYEDRLDECFGKRVAPGSILPAALKGAAAHRLLNQKWFARRVVLDRWFLHARQPALSHGIVRGN
jgi:flavin-dependent dehydrogenase